jgi:hypothetical protein
VNGVVGGNSTVGTVTAQGVYTAPSTVSSLTTMTVSAASQPLPGLSGSDSILVFPVGSSPSLEGYAFVSPNSLVCDYGADFAAVSAPCLSQTQSSGTALSLSVDANNAVSQVTFDGVNLAVTASTTAATTDNRADAVATWTNSYVLTSSTLDDGTLVTLSFQIPRTGTLDAFAVIQDDVITAQEFFDINVNFNGIDAMSEINQRVHVDATALPFATTTSLADSDVFTFGIAGGVPVVLSAPTIVADVVAGPGNSVPLGTLTVNFTVPVGLPFMIGLYDHVNTHGGDTGNSISSGVIPGVDFAVPADVEVNTY